MAFSIIAAIKRKTRMWNCEDGNKRVTYFTFQFERHFLIQVMICQQGCNIRDQIPDHVGKKRAVCREKYVSALFTLVLDDEIHLYIV